MKITEVQHHGLTRYKIETGNGFRRKRQFFETLGEAESAVKAALKHKAELGKAWDVLLVNEKVEIMSTLKEIKKAGWTLAEIWEGFQSINSSPRSCTLSKAVEEVVAAKKLSKRSARYIDNLEWYLGRFIEGRESLPVSSIGEKEIAEWFASRKEAPRSQNQHMGLLSALFTYCWRQRYVSENPIARMERVSIQHQVPAILNVRQSAKSVLWVRRNNPKFLAWLSLALFVGMRPESEAQLITWKDIDLANKRIVITRSKTKHPRIVDLGFCPPALHWLKVAKKLGAKLPLGETMRLIYTRGLRNALGLKAWPQDVLRHTAASYLLAYHQDAGKVAAFLGNSAGILLKHYKALVFKEDAERFMAILPKPRHFDISNRHL